MIDALVFALRCAAACALSFLLAAALGLQQPWWAAMSAVIVSGENLGETRAALASRIGATLLGALVAVAVGEAGAAVNAPLTADFAAGVAATALIAHRWPSLRSAMWTSTLVLVLAGGAAGLPKVALLRACEFTLGGVVAWAIHAMSDVFRPQGAKG
jgi:uncharacterized membrane protein YccC